MLPDVPFLRAWHWDQARTSPSPVNSRRESSVLPGQRWEGNFTGLVQLTPWSSLRLGITMSVWVIPPKHWKSLDTDNIILKDLAKCQQTKENKIKGLFVCIPSFLLHKIGFPITFLFWNKQSYILWSIGRHCKNIAGGGDKTPHFHNIFPHSCTIWILPKQQYKHTKVKLRHPPNPHSKICNYPEPKPIKKLI